MSASMLLAVISCEKETEEISAPEIKIDNNVIEAPHKGDEYNIPYKVENPAEGEELHASTESEWIIDLTADQQVISFTVTENTSGANRQGTILLKYKDAADISLTVSQTFNPAEITLSNDKTQCDYKGGEYSFTVEVKNPVDGVELSMSNDNEWITGLKEENGTVTFIIPENNSGKPRSGKIAFQYGESNVNHSIEQSFEAAEIKARQSYECGEEGGEHTISYSIENPRKEGKVEASCESEWLTVSSIEDDKITFNVLANEDSERTAIIKLSYLTAEDLEINIVQNEAAYQYESENLSANGTANSYIISASGDYRLKAVKGNGIEKVGEIASVEVLWESFGTPTAPQEGDLIKDPRTVNNYIEFTVSDPFKKGNAVIAAKDASGKILWSWHIWLTEKPEEQVYFNGAGTFMDRNLGATSAVPGEVGTMGLLYQWGRKDPFLNSSSISDRAEQAKSTLTWPSAESSNSSSGTIEFAIENPTTFIMSNYSNYDWNYTGSSSNDDTRWQSEKTIYDPCPVGYRVPDGGEEGVWATAFGTSSFMTITFDKEKAGADFGASSGNTNKLTDSPMCWYPSAGCRDHQTSLLSGSSTGYYWSCSPDGRMAYYMTIYGYGGVAVSYSYNRACGMSIRCVKE